MIAITSRCALTVATISVGNDAIIIIGAIISVTCAVACASVSRFSPPPSLSPAWCRILPVTRASVAVATCSLCTASSSPCGRATSSTVTMWELFIFFRQNMPSVYMQADCILVRNFFSKRCIIHLGFTDLRTERKKSLTSTADHIAYASFKAYFRAKGQLVYGT